MASIIDTTRIVDLPTKASLSEGDVFVVDNENGATSKISAAAVSGSSTSGLVAEEYSNASTYEVGEYCIHEEAGIPKLYKCTTAIATAESWTPAHWEGTDAGAEITDLNQNLAELKYNNMAEYVNVTSATSENPYVFTSDGYLRIAASGASVYITLAGATSGRAEFLVPDGVREPIYVKKGMRFFGKTGGNGGMTAYFWQFI